MTSRLVHFACQALEMKPVRRLQESAFPLCRFIDGKCRPDILRNIPNRQILIAEIEAVVSKELHPSTRCADEFLHT